MKEYRNNWHLPLPIRATAATGHPASKEVKSVVVAGVGTFTVKDAYPGLNS